MRRGDERKPRSFREVAMKYRPAALATDPAAARSVVFLAVILMVVLGLGGYLFMTARGSSSPSGPPPLIPEVEPGPPTPAPPPPAEIPDAAVPAQPADVDALLDRLARGFQDGTAPTDLTSSPFLELALLVRDAAVAERIVARVTPGLGALDLLREPEAHRGKCVRIRGRVVQSKQYPFLPGVPDRPEWIQVAYVEDEASAQTVALFFFPGEGAPKFHVERVQTSQGPMEFVTDWIEAEGIFLRAWQYESQWRPRGRAMPRTAAVVLSPRVRTIEPPPVPEPDWMLYGGVGAGIVLLVLGATWVGVRRGRRAAAERALSLPRLRKDAPPS